MKTEEERKTRRNGTGGGGEKGAERGCAWVCYVSSAWNKAMEEEAYKKHNSRLEIRLVVPQHSTFSNYKYLHYEILLTPSIIRRFTALDIPSEGESAVSRKILRYRIA